MSSAYDPAAWSTLFAALVGASATLAGLIFVAVSINLANIVKSRPLVARAAKALLALMLVLIVSIYALIPGASDRTLGCDILFSSAISWILVTLAQHRSSYKNPYISRRIHVIYTVLTQFASLPFIITGLSLIVHTGGGLNWLPTGVILSFIVAFMDAWVLLIEIQR